MKKLTLCLVLVALCLAVYCQEPVTTEPAEGEPPAEITMTPEAALNNVSLAVAQYQGTWDEHLILRRSVQVLAEALGLYE